MKRIIRFATSNKDKVKEATRILSEFGLKVDITNTKPIEIQADTNLQIARNCALQLWRKCEEPTIVEDSGFYVHKLTGFPGPYSSFVFHTIGVNGVLKLMEKATNRRAHFVSAVAFVEKNKPIRTFQGRVTGVVSKEARGNHGFGFDPIFIPDGKQQTFAEMTTGEKSVLSHRGKTLRAFAKWFVEAEQA